MITYGAVESRLAQVIDGYERREPQERLAHAIANSLDAGTHLLGEAGCGTGKSYAGLIPAILWATQNRKRLVYSTATKALQDQLTLKDLPALQAFFAENFDLKVKWSLLKGRSNYFCAHRAEGVSSDEAAELGDMLRVVNEGHAGNGEKTDFERVLGYEIAWGTWNKVRAESDSCSDNLCSKVNDGRCFADNARRAAKDSHIVVVNHALFSMDLLFNNAMIGEYSAVIFDEAHELRTYVRDALGYEFSERSLISLITEVRNLVRREFGESEEVVAKAANKANAAQKVLFATFSELPEIKEGATTARLRPSSFRYSDEVMDAWVNFVNTVDDYAANIERVAPHLNGQSTASLTATQKRLQTLKKRARNLSDRINLLVTGDFAEIVRWVEIEKDRNGDNRFLIKSCPIDVAPFLSENLFADITCILISATLQVNGKFDFIAAQLGVGNHNSLNVGTPFDFKEQARFFVPNTKLDPAANRQAFDTASLAYMEQLIKASDGRALVLFTSVRAMKNAYEYLSGRLPYTVLCQGQGDNKALAAEFKADTHSVLLGTKSFMTGVDFQGDTCSLVIVDKLPFPVPTEPLFEAEAEIVDARYGNRQSFPRLTMPIMSLVISQAFGRLIRTKADKGVFALLDPRVVSKNYGRQIVSTLPDAPMIRDLADVENFFSGF